MSSEVVAFGYIGVTAPDLDEWRSFATEVLGLAVGPGTTAERLQLRMDDRTWRISVEPGPGGLAYCGWEVANATALEALATRLDTFGIPYKRDEQLAKERAVKDLILCSDPGGNQIEFFYGAMLTQEPFVSPTGARFVTSDKVPGDMGFGHAVISFPNGEEAKRFYFDVLDFTQSDTITRPPGPNGEQVTLWFFHVNPRHHSIAFGSGASGRPSALGHFMVEVEEIDMVGRALDTVMQRGIEIQSTLGRHSNDHMISFYVKTPSGFAVEYGTGARKIDDTAWNMSDYDIGHVWGHHRGSPAPAAS